MSFDGQKCPVARCAILNVFTDAAGKQVSSAEAAAPFVTVWKKSNPTYKSPYEDSTNNTNRKLGERSLATSASKPI